MTDDHPGGTRIPITCPSCGQSLSAWVRVRDDVPPVPWVCLHCEQSHVTDLGGDLVVLAALTCEWLLPPDPDR